MTLPIRVKALRPGYPALMSETHTYSKGIFSSDHQEARERIVELLKQAYWMEIETVISYITNSVNVDGIRAQEIRDAYYSDTYFALTKELLEAEGREPRVTMQVFAKRQGVLGGIDEALAVLRLCSGQRCDDGSWADGWPDLTVHALHEGEPIEA